MHLPMTLQKHIASSTTYGYEPSINELLAEPIVRQLMARDGVQEGCINRQMERVARALAATRALQVPAN